MIVYKIGLFYYDNNGDNPNHTLSMYRVVYTIEINI